MFVSIIPPESATPRHAVMKEKEKVNEDILLGLGLIKRGVPGMRPFSIDKMALINPELPAAGSEWPILLLIDPTRSGFSGERVAAKTEPTPFTSVGSPAWVPVPWHSR